MSTNLATIFVGLGYDLSALEKGAPEAFRMINNQTLGMSAQMKRASREGAESLRLIDEALGIHLSRPLTRILTQEFPGLAKGLQSVLGAGVIGAIGVAGVELFDKIGKSIEKAQKAQEDLKLSTENVDKVFAQELDAYREKDKAITASTAAVDRLAEAEAKQAKAAQEASGWFTGTLAAIGDWLHKASSFQSTLGLEEINGELGKFKERFDLAAVNDSLNKTHTAAKVLEQEIEKVREALGRLQSQKTAQDSSWWSWLTPGSGVSQAEISAAQNLIEGLTRLQQVRSATETGVHNQEAQAEALKRQAAAAKDIEELYRSIGESMKKLAPETDPLKKLADEIHLMRAKAESEFRDLGRNTDDALQLRAARAALAQYEANLDRVFSKAKAEADVLKAQADLPTKIAATGAAPQFTAAGVLPQLGAGGTAGAQVDVFMKDQVAQLKLAAQAYQDLMTPESKYQVMEQELGVLLERRLIDLPAYTAALQNAREQMAKQTDQLQKLLEKTDSASAGLQAFFLQLENQAGKGGAGTFTFDILNRGLQGFEDETVKALTGAKTSWRSYFAELDAMALKFLLNKEIAGLFKGMAGTSIGKSLGLDKLMGGGTQAAAETANTTALVANTTALASLTAALSMSGIAGGAGGAGGFGMSDLFAAGIPAFAGGTDFAPGGMSLVGENGPELVNLPTGSSVMPNSALRHGVSLPTYIDARGAQMGVAEQIAKSWEANAPLVIARAVVEASESRRRTPPQS